MVQFRPMKLFSKLGIVSLSLALFGSAFAAGCGGDDESLPTVDCTTGDVPTFAQVNVFTNVCANCHGVDVAGEDRQGAPADINFDDFASAKAHAEKAASEVNGGDMPPGGSDEIAPADKEALYKWALCGTPQ
jgi:uncharacterized membrane protein